MDDERRTADIPDCPWYLTDERRPDAARALRRRARAGEVLSIGPGRYADADRWRSLRPDERHHVAVRSAAHRIPAGYAVSHRSAAALLDVPAVDAWPARVHLTSVRQRRRTTNATFIVHDDLDPDLPDVRRLRPSGIPVTGPVRTAADLAVASPFLPAVVALDPLLARGADPEAVLASIRRRRQRGRSRAIRAVTFADAASGSVGESVARVRFAELGSPAPELQRRFREPGEPDIVVDFWFPEQGVVVEFDGEVEYQDRTMLAGRSPARAVIDEKYREDRLRAMPGVRTVVRLCWADLWNLPVLREKLRRAGIPTSR